MLPVPRAVQDGLRRRLADRLPGVDEQGAGAFRGFRDPLGDQVAALPEEFGRIERAPIVINPAERLPCSV